MASLIGACVYILLLVPALILPSHDAGAHPRAYLREFGTDPTRIVIDASLNVAAFVPLGWLLYRAARPRSVTALGCVLGVAGACAALSLSVETLQFFIASRHSSVVDVLADAAGALLGAVTGRALGAPPT
jgi:VanZ family protein